jgi:hypothetical protein
MSSLGNALQELRKDRSATQSRALERTSILRTRLNAAAIQLAVRQQPHPVPHHATG